MRNATVVFEVSRGPPVSPYEVNIREVCANHQGERGKARLAVQARLAQSDCGKRVCDVVHRNWKLETGNWNLAIGEARRVSEFSGCQFLKNGYPRPTELQ